jgi:hypothetical protein
MRNLTSIEAQYRTNYSPTQLRQAIDEALSARDEEVDRLEEKIDILVEDGILKQARIKELEAINESLLRITKDEAKHILQTQEYLCEVAGRPGEDGSCLLCRSIKAKLQPLLAEEKQKKDNKEEDK